MEVIYSKDEMEEKTYDSIDSLIRGCILGLVLIFLFMTCVCPIAVISGSSMEPTLQDSNIVVQVNSVLFTPERGDMVSAYSTALDIVVAKRVIAVAGDTVEIKDCGTVYINGVAQEEDYISGNTSDYDGLSVEVPEGYVFLMGDNRPYSTDSRYFGCVAVDDIYGKIAFVIY